MSRVSGGISTHKKCSKRISISWLSNVHNLLEQLDGTVEEVIEEQRDEEVNNLDSILAKRGLKEDVTEEDPVDLQEGKNGAFDVAEDAETQVGIALESPDVITENSTRMEDSISGTKLEKSKAIDDVEPELSREEVSEESRSISEDMNDQASEDESIMNRSESKGKVTEDLSKNEISAATADEKLDDKSERANETTVLEKQEASSTEDSIGELPKSISDPSQIVVSSSYVSEEKYKQALSDVGELQRETRTLRRHVVSLNKQLESAETELEAQRVELSQAGDRLEINRKKAKEEKEKLIAQHNSLLKTLQQEKDQLLSEIKTRHQQQLEGLQQKLRESDEKRMQEGGDWTKELESTIERERDLVRNLALLE